MWYLQLDEQEEGPLSDEDLLERVETGEIGPDAQVRREDGEWMPAGDVDELAPAFAAPLEVARDHGPALLIFGWITVGISLLELGRLVLTDEPRHLAINNVLANPDGPHILGAIVFLAAVRCWPALLGVVAALFAWRKYGHVSGKKVFGCELIVISGLVIQAFAP